MRLSCVDREKEHTLPAPPPPEAPASVGADSQPGRGARRWAACGQLSHATARPTTCPISHLLPSPPGHGCQQSDRPMPKATLGLSLQDRRGVLNSANIPDASTAQLPSPDLDMACSPQTHWGSWSRSGARVHPLPSSSVIWLQRL